MSPPQAERRNVVTPSRSSASICIIPPAARTGYIHTVYVEPDIPRTDEHTDII